MDKDDQGRFLKLAEDSTLINQGYTSEKVSIESKLYEIKVNQSGELFPERGGNTKIKM